MYCLDFCLITYLIITQVKMQYRIKKNNDNNLLVITE